MDGAPTLIVIEEAWAALMRSDFASRMQQWLLTLRKQNAAVVIVAHTVAQIRQLRNAHIITESCPTRIMLPNAEARVPEHAEVYKFLDLGDREIDVIATAQPKSQYYLRTPESGRVVQLALDKRARAVLMPLPGMTAERSREHIIGAMDKYGDHFLEPFRTMKRTYYSSHITLPVRGDQAGGSAMAGHGCGRVSPAHRAVGGA